MSEFTMDRLRENLESLKMKNTLEILDNYLERAVAENLNIVDVLDHIFAEEAKSKRKRAYEKQIQMSGFPIKKTLDDFDFSFQPSIDKRQIDELATMRFLENGENVVFLGPPGDTTFSPFSRNRMVASSSIWRLSMEGWKEKSKSSRVFLMGKPDI